VKAGYQPGLATVHRGHYFLPIVNGSTWVDTLVCRLDLERSPWTRWAGHAAGTAYAVRVGATTRSPKLFGARRHARHRPHRLHGRHERHHPGRRRHHPDVPRRRERHRHGPRHPAEHDREGPLRLRDHRAARRRSASATRPARKARATRRRHRSAAAARARARTTRRGRCPRRRSGSASGSSAPARSTASSSGAVRRRSASRPRTSGRRNGTNRQGSLIRQLQAALAGQGVQVRDGHAHLAGSERLHQHGHDRARPRHHPDRRDRHGQPPARIVTVHVHYVSMDATNVQWRGYAPTRRAAPRRPKRSPGP
jgi:hypothetical protein